MHNEQKKRAELCEHIAEVLSAAERNKHLDQSSSYNLSFVGVS